MDILLTILLWVLVIVAGVLLLVLIMPVQVRLQGGVKDEGLNGWVRLRWAWGLVGFHVAPQIGVRLHVMGIPVWTLGKENLTPEEEKRREEKKRQQKARKQKEKKEKEEKKKKEQQKRQQEGKSPKLGRKAMGVRKVTKVFGQLAARALWLLHPRGYIRGIIGCTDPADTAALHGVLLVVTAHKYRWMDLDKLQVNYVDEIVEVDCMLRAMVIPVEVVVVALRQLLRPEVRQVMRS